MVKGNNATFNYSTDRARIAELEAENAALREFVAVFDEVDERLLNADAFDALALDSLLQESRQRLSTEHGLPLPGAGEDGE